VLDFASAQNISPRSSVRWRDILDQLDKYDAGKPGNTLTVLENFIRIEMDKVKLDNCSAIIASGRQPLDYFIRVRNSLRQPFHTRCRELEDVARARAEEAAREAERLAKEKKVAEFCNSLESYTEIQREFNQTLAGRFPFSKLPEGEPFAEADPESIRAFFELLSKNKDKAKLVLEQSKTVLEESPEYNVSPQAALDFLEQVEALRSVFDAFLTKKQVYPILDFNLRFRVNACKETGANQVIDWAFDVGKKRFHYRDIDPAGIWGYGEPLSLSLRWANDSPTVPSAKFNPLSHMKLEGQTVTLTYNNNWSLLYLIYKHKGKGVDFCEGVDLEPYTLKIEIPTQPNPELPNNLQQAQPKTLRTTSSEVFLSIGLMAAGKKDPLVLPEFFPTVAPHLPFRCLVAQPGQENRSN
jgi:type VI secretion system protein ImpL